MQQNITLMYRDMPVATLSMSANRPIGYKTIFQPNDLPVGSYHENDTTAKILFQRWYESRTIPQLRQTSIAFEQSFNKSYIELVLENAGVSITDGYWLKREDDNISWQDINYHENGFDELLLQIKMNLTISGVHSPDLTTDGVMDKFWHNVHGIPYLAKIDTQKHGVLTANEVLYSTIAESAGVHTTPYFYGEVQGIKYCTCPCFIQNASEDFISAMQVKHQDMRLSGNRLLHHFMYDLGFATEIRQMMSLDCIFHNTDRHEKNFGFIVSSDSRERRFAPLYDNGYCLGANHSDYLRINDSDMKLLPDSRYDILNRYGIELAIDADFALSELKRIYELYNVSEQDFIKAKNELVMGLEIYHESQKKKMYSIENIPEAEIER